MRYPLEVARISKKPGTYHHGDLRRVLLEAALKVVDQEGVGALSLHAIAQRASVSSGAPYHHFASREELLAALAEEGFALLAEEMRSAVAKVGADARAYLEGLGRGYIRFALTHRGHFRVMFRPELQAHVDAKKKEHMNEAFFMLERAIARCQAEGLAPAGDPAPLVLISWSAVHGASVLWIDGSLAKDGLVADGAVLEEAVAGTLVALLTRSAASPPRAPRPR